MYEPTDGKNTAETAYKEVIAAYNQAQAITISTHRYNYTRSEEQCSSSLAGLDTLLKKISQLPKIRFLSSPELGEAMATPEQTIKNHFNNSQWEAIAPLIGIKKFSAFLYRLYYRLEVRTKSRETFKSSG